MELIEDENIQKLQAHLQNSAKIEFNPKQSYMMLRLLLPLITNAQDNINGAIFFALEQFYEPNIFIS